MLISYWLLANPRFRLEYGMTALFSSILVPAILLTISWPDMLEQFLRILNSFPVLHIPLFLIVFAILYPQFRDLTKETGFFTSKGADEVVSFFGSLMACAAGYYFLIVLISTGFTLIAFLLLTSSFAMLILKISMRERGRFSSISIANSIRLERLKKKFNGISKLLAEGDRLTVARIISLLMQIELEVKMLEREIPGRELGRIREGISLWLNVLRGIEPASAISSEHREILEQDIRYWRAIVESIK